MPLLDTGSSTTAHAHLKLLPLSTHAPLKSRSGPTEQSSLLSQFPGAATRAERIRHDGTWGPLFPHTSFSPSQSLLLHAPVGKAASVLSPLSSRRSCSSATSGRTSLEKQSKKQPGLEGCHMGLCVRVQRAVSRMEGSGSDSRGFAAIRDKFSTFLLLQARCFCPLLLSP